jgi:hypothetical protein
MFWHLGNIYLKNSKLDYSVLEDMFVTSCDNEKCLWYVITEASSSDYKPKKYKIRNNKHQQMHQKRI